MGDEPTLNEAFGKPYVSSPDETVTGFLYDATAEMVLEPET